MHKLLLAGVFLTGMSLAVPAQNGTITGQVRDASGRPATGVRVAAAEAGNSQSSSSVLAAISETDSTGRYRLENIPPGRYHILAGLIDYPTYYPGVTGAAEAKVVEIQNGSGVTGLDFSMLWPTTVKVSGHVGGLKTVSPLPVALFGATGAPLQTETKADGSFEFDEVPLGSYTLRAPGVIPVNISAVDKNVKVNLTPLYSGPGVQVSGKVIGKSAALQPGIRRTASLNPIATNPVTGTHVAVPGSAGTTINGALETFVNTDGSFEFASVPPGPYLLRIQPAAPGVPSPRLDIADQDVRGLEIAIPFQFDIPGRVQVEGRNIGSSAVIEASQNNFTTSTSILPDGTFRLRLTEGENRISLARLPLDLTVKSITYGGQDITAAPLKLDGTSSPQEMIVRLEARPARATPGVKVSGRATGPGKQSVIGLAVSLSPIGSAGKAAETTVGEDGRFEFTRVTSGSYMLRFAAPIATLTRIVVGDKDVSGLEVPIAARVEVAGRISVVDAGGNVFQMMPADLSVIFQVSNGGSAAASMESDRTFRILLPEDRYTLLVRNLPATYSVRSIASGSLDLTKEPLNIDAQSPPRPIEVVLEYKPGR